MVKETTATRETTKRSKRRFVEEIIFAIGVLVLWFLIYFFTR